MPEIKRTLNPNAEVMCGGQIQDLIYAVMKSGKLWRFNGAEWKETVRVPGTERTTPDEGVALHQCTKCGRDYFNICLACQFPDHKKFPKLEKENPP